MPSISPVRLLRLSQIFLMDSLAPISFSFFEEVLKIACLLSILQGYPGCWRSSFCYPLNAQSNVCLVSLNSAESGQLSTHAHESSVKALLFLLAAHMGNLPWGGGICE